MIRMNDWYSPAEIIYNRDQWIWIMSYLPDLIKRDWPPDPRGTGYIDAPIGTKSRTIHAPFEMVSMVVSEIEVRLSRLGKDRAVLEERYTNNVYEDDIAYDLKVPVNVIHQRLNSALWYVTGKRKRMSYSNWKKQRKYRRK